MYGYHKKKKGFLSLVDERKYGVSYLMYRKIDSELRKMDMCCQKSIKQFFLDMQK